MLLVNPSGYKDTLGVSYITCRRAALSIRPGFAIAEPPLSTIFNHDLVSYSVICGCRLLKIYLNTAYSSGALLGSLEYAFARFLLSISIAYLHNHA